MALVPVFAGMKATAALIASIAPQAAVKQVDQPVTSSVVQVNDTGLFLPVVANAQYLFACYLDYEGDTNAGTANAGINWSWNLPGGATMRYTYLARTVGAAQTANPPTSVGATTNVAAGSNGAAFLCGALMLGTLFMGTAAGNMGLAWAQNASSAVATIVHAQSVLALWRLS